MKKTMLTVCALAMLTACGKNHSDSGSASDSTMTASRAFVEDFKKDGSNVVYFGFDKSSLSDEAAVRLEKKIEAMKNCPNISYVVEGYADPRGTEDYNLALGEKRATAVKRFFLDRGIQDHALTVISYGKEESRLADTGTTEEAYAKNRRAEVVPN